VSGEDDDEALTWAGARDPSHYETPEAKPVKARRSKAVAATNAATDVGGEPDAVEPEADERAPMSSVVLVCLGVLGGIYALYTIGWFVSWQRLVYPATSDVLEVAAFHIQQVLGILAPPLWFVATILFTRDRKPATRLLWLVVGALVLVPWSFTFGQ
jgi:hypothetical protein